MARAQTKTRASGARRPTRGRPPRRSWLQRNAIWVGAAAVVIVGVVALVSRGRDDGTPVGTSGAPAGFVGGDFHSLVADPATPGRLFVGGHQAVSASTDGGQTWSRIRPLDDADAMGWGFAGDDIFVSGHPGISRSTDGGGTFRHANDGLPDTDIHAFGAGSSVLYGAGPAVGVIASTDGGKSWAARTQDAGQSFFGRIIVAADDPQHLIAADAQAGATESTDGGRTWKRLAGPPSAVWVSSGAGGLYVSGPQGAARSVDGGKSFEPLDLPAGATLVEADPTSENVLYAGVHSGDSVQVWVSRDGGGRWARP